MYSGTDYLTEEGANKLADKIRKYWLETKGKLVETWIVSSKSPKESNPNYMNFVRSNLYKGLPR